MKYKEAEKYLGEIHHSDEMLFRMAVSHLMDVGIQSLTEENVNATCEEIMKQDDSRSFMSNRYQCDIVKTAAKLTKVSHIDLLIYISRHIKYAEV